MKRTLIVSWLMLGCMVANLRVVAREFEKIFKQELPEPKVYLILNQPKYAPGDTVFFKAYFLHEDRTPVRGKQILELNLVDEQGGSQIHLKFSVNDGIGSNQFHLPNSHPAGIYLLTVHSTWMLNFDPPGFFQQEIKVVNDKKVAKLDGSTRAVLKNSIESAEGVKVGLEKGEFGTRERVEVSLALTGEDGKSIQGEFSVKVLNQSVFEGEPSISLVGQVSLKKEQGKNISSGEPKHFYTTILERNGTAYNAETSERLADYTQLVFYLQNSQWRYQTFTNNGGRVSLAIPDFYGMDEFFYMGMTREKEEVNNIRIEWDNVATPDLPAAPDTQVLNEEDQYGAFQEKRKTIDKSYGFFTSSIAAEVNDERLAELEKMLGGADAVYEVDDYARFSSMKELIKEVIKYMKQRGSGDKTRVRISLLEPPIGDPLYIIDGIVTKNTDFFLSLDPASLKTIKIIKDHFKLPQLGLFGKNGIVLVETKSGDVREPLQDESKLLQGLNQPVALNNISEADIQNTDVPLFRSAIFWDPSITIGKDGKATINFFTSDDIGTYQILVDGITTEGNVFSIRDYIEVNAENP